MLLGGSNPFIFNHGFEEFVSAKHHVRGLRRVAGTKLEILAIISTRPGEGNVHRFFDECKTQFTEICVWEIWNADFYKMLKRWDFKPGKTKDPSGKKVKGLCWNR